MRSAWCPWSCSPMGPAPTREPRMALPPDAMRVARFGVAGRSGARGEPGDQTDDDDAREPDQREDHRDAVEVAFGDAGRAEARRDAAAEHVGEAAAAPTMQQDQQGQEQARD